jgi:hypothetical protein
MTDDLTREDWQRIADALAHFKHHPDYIATLKKVTAILQAK